MEFSKLVDERYSLRKFSERPVEDEKLALIKIEDDGASEIARRSRGIPRIANRL